MRRYGPTQFSDGVGGRVVVSLEGMLGDGLSAIVNDDPVRRWFRGTREAARLGADLPQLEQRKAGHLGTARRLSHQRRAVVDARRSVVRFLQRWVAGGPRLPFFCHGSQLEVR